MLRHGFPNSAFIFTSVLVLTLPDSCLFAQNAIPDRLTRHESVLLLKPAGYWPADEGEGDILHDLSGNDNHGVIHHTPWRDGLLDFISAFQWCEVPASDAWQGDAVSVGGWVFTREQKYRRNGMMFMGVANPIRLWIEPSIILRVRASMELEVVSDGNADAIGSLAEKDTIAAGMWQHVLYTWEGGTGKLYVNGKLVRSADNVPFELRKKHRLLIGSDADWWMLHPPGSNSLNGSVRDLVLLNRALTPDEITQLQTATRPTQTPWLPSPNAIMVNGQALPFSAFAQAPVDTRYAVLKKLKWDSRSNYKMLRERRSELQPVLVGALEVWQTRALAAELLLRIDRKGNGDLLKQKLPEWIEAIGDEALPAEERAACAMGLMTLKSEAKPAVPVLTQVLRGLLPPDGSRLPKVEELLRNALALALFEIDPDNAEVAALLDQALRNPQLDGNAYFSQGDANRDSRVGTPNERAYTPVATYKGVTYTLGAAKSFGAVEPVSPAEFSKRVEAIAATYPEARTWRAPDFPHLYRVKIVKTMPEGTEAASYLGGEDFIFDGTDAKVRGWSVVIDTAGYIHIVGGQHNAPNPDAFIPGSWEKLGLSRNREDENYPNQIYFVSKRPGDISEFEFVGARNNPRQITSPGYLNYMNWVQDNNGELFLYGRINVGGWQSWGVYHYDVEAQRWLPLGGDACDVVADAKSTHPGWLKYLHHNIRGGIPKGPDTKSMVWAWQPHFYNYCRDGWGIKFDPANRMHLFMAIRGLSDSGRIIDSRVYAWSDDLGKTFHRADGSPVALPLTVNPAPKHNANINSCRHQIHWEAYDSLIRRTGVE